MPSPALPAAFPPSEFEMGADGGGDASDGLDHAELDAQHERLREGFARFAALAQGDWQRTESVECLRELIAAVGRHFGFEEALMVESGFPEFDHHLRQHLGMMTELGLLLDRVQDGSDAAVVRQVDFVNEWYLRHVDFSDRKFTNWLAR